MASSLSLRVAVYFRRQGGGGEGAFTTTNHVSWPLWVQHTIVRRQHEIVNQGYGFIVSIQISSSGLVISHQAHWYWWCCTPQRQFSVGSYGSRGWVTHLLLVSNHYSASEKWALLYGHLSMSLWAQPLGCCLGVFIIACCSDAPVRVGLLSRYLRGVLRFYLLLLSKPLPHWSSHLLSLVPMTKLKQW